MNVLRHDLNFKPMQTPHATFDTACVRPDIRAVTVRFGDKLRTIKGRMAWALSQLIAAGPDGCTPITHPGPRWSHYVFKLRQEGINVETIHEMHGGAYAGHHARYVLRSAVEVLEVMTAQPSLREAA